MSKKEKFFLSCYFVICKSINLLYMCEIAILSRRSFEDNPSYLLRYFTICKRLWICMKLPSYRKEIYVQQEIISSYVIHITFVQRNKTCDLSILGILILTWIFILFPSDHEIGFGVQFGVCNYFLIVRAYTYAFIHLFSDVLTFFSSTITFLIYTRTYTFIYIYTH